MSKQSLSRLSFAMILALAMPGALAFAANGAAEATLDSKAAEKSVRMLEDRDEKGWITGRLEIGWRAAFAKVDDDSCWHEDKEEGFLGTMSFFDEADDVQPYNLVVAYHFCDWFGISASWDQISVIARTHTADAHEDGEWKEKGPTLTAVLMTPRIYDIFVPYAEAGVHFPSAKFDAYPWWALGYSSNQDYHDRGCPKILNGGYRRNIDASETDSTTFVWGVGLKIFLTDNLSIDVAYRHIDVDETAHFILKHAGRVTRDNGYYDIPLSYSELCAGLRWAF